MLHAYVVELEHVVTVPEIVHVMPPPGAATVAQVPACDAVAPTQLPPQHWVFAVQESPFCLQNDVAVLQKPLMQPFEQHWLSAVQVLPEAAQVPPFVDAQRPPLHLPLQQSAPLVQARPTFLHWPLTHWPSALQWPEQHCESLWHAVAEPVVMHGPARLPHWFGA